MTVVAVCPLVRWTGVAASLLLVSQSTGAQRDPYPVDSVHVEIRAWRDSSRVTTRLWFAQAVRVLDYTYLSNSCTTVGSLIARRAGAPVAVIADTNPPWIVLHDTSDAAGATPGPQMHVLTYAVTHRGRARVAIPIVQPAGPLSARNASVQSKVHLKVIGQDQLAGEPFLPRFTVMASREWEARMVAVPSQVVIATGTRMNTVSCESAVHLPGKSGGFLRLVALLVATIVLWIPLYFWWATRRRTSDKEGEG